MGVLTQPPAPVRDTHHLLHVVPVAALVAGAPSGPGRPILSFQASGGSSAEGWQGWLMASLTRAEAEARARLLNISCYEVRLDWASAGGCSRYPPGSTGTLSHLLRQRVTDRQRADRRQNDLARERPEHGRAVCQVVAHAVGGADEVLSSFEEGCPERGRAGAGHVKRRHPQLGCRASGHECWY